MTVWARAEAVAPHLGPLERRVLELMWQRSDPSSVRDLHPDFGTMAYTTLMTTLDRLFRKGLLTRTKRGRAYEYETRCTQAQFLAECALSSLRAALDDGGPTVSLVMSFFVTAVGERDSQRLDELEALVRARQAEVKVADATQGPQALSKRRDAGTINAPIP